MASYCLLLFFFLLGFGFSAPTPTATATATATLDEPCAAVASMVAESAGKPPAFVDDDMYPKIPAAVAMACLYSTPFNATYAEEWLESFKPYLQWQSTLAYLKKPPPGYFRPPHDILGLLEAMIAKVRTTGYETELHFEEELYRTFAFAYDGHTRYFPMIFNGIFSFGRSVPLVSVSIDGKTAPRAYVYSDILLSLNDTSFTPSPITHLWGKDVEEQLQRTALWGVSVDKDASYNSLFMNLAQASLRTMGNGAGIWAGGGRGTIEYPGRLTNITFENGTFRTWENFARVLQDFSGIRNGQDLRDRFLPTNSTSPWLPVPSNGTGSNKTTMAEDHEADKRAISGPPGYPSPVKLLPGNYVSGYYLTGQGYENVAVLALASFGGSGTQKEYQSIVFDFIAQAKATGKTRLIIDVSANGGGQIPQAFSVFKNLFPDIDPYGGNRFRAFKDFDLIGQQVTKAVGSAYPWQESMPPPPGLLLNDFVATPFIATADMNMTGQPFKSWEEKYGPHEHNGDQFTSIMRWNLSDPALVDYAGFDPNLFGPQSTILNTRPFAAEDIVILSDGYCASSCAIFLELMTQQAKVKTVAVGGMASTPVGMMQAVGGVRGVNVYTFYTIGSFVREATSLAHGTSQQAEMEGIYEKYTSIPLDRSADGDGRLNVRDSIRLGDTEEVPIQFRYEPADCRIFYEKEHTVDVSTLWKSVYDVAWGGDRCAIGGISKPRQSRSAKTSNPHKRHTMRKLHEEEVSHLRDTWRYGTDVNKIKSMRGFQMP